MDEPKKIAKILNRVALCSSIVMSFYYINMIVFVFISVGIEIILLDTKDEWSDNLKLILCVEVVAALYSIYMFGRYWFNK